MTQNKVTVLEAANALNIGRKTIYRWISKGLLSKHKEGNKSFVILEDVRALCDRGVTQQDTDNVTDSVSDTTADTLKDTKDTNTVTLDRQHYEGLLIRLGQYEAERRYLLEYKGGIEAKEQEIERLRQENEGLRNRSWWRRLFSK